uniref:Transposase n=1 Tax=mine drainage metagenome TaxID=410659 RepID=E6QU60_9ZZZZ
MTTTAERMQIIELVTEAMTAGARQDRACEVICLNERTLQRWQRDRLGGDKRPRRER